MPVATPFSSRGRGNGFTQCFLSLDASVYDYWTTLSGFNKDSIGTPSGASIAESLQLAMNLYWNIYKINVDGSAVQDFGTAYTATMTSADDTSVSTHARAEPRDRACGGVGRFLKNRSTPSATSCELFFSTGDFITKIYDGVVTDEDNFRGYAFLGYWLNMYCTAGSSTHGTQIRLYAAQDEKTATAPVVYEVDYAALSDGTTDYHVVCRVKSSSTRNASSMTGTSSSGTGYDTDATINDIEFYTYP